MIVYAWVMACATIICGGKRGKEYPPLGDPRIMRRAINFFFSLPSSQSYAIVLADSRKSIIIHRRLFHRMEYAFFHFTRSFFPSDISMVKSNFSPLDSHRLTYGQRGGGGGGWLNVFLSNFNPSARFFALVFISRPLPPVSSVRLIQFYPISTNVPPILLDLLELLLTGGIKIKMNVTLERLYEFNRVKNKGFIIIPIICNILVK